MSFVIHSFLFFMKSLWDYFYCPTTWLHEWSFFFLHFSYSYAFLWLYLHFRFMNEISASFEVVFVKSPNETVFESLKFWIRSQSLNLSRICSFLNTKVCKETADLLNKSSILLLPSHLSFVKGKRFSWFLDAIFKFLMFRLYHWQLDKLNKVHLTPTRLLISSKKLNPHVVPFFAIARWPNSTSFYQFFARFPSH